MDETYSTNFNATFALHNMLYIVLDSDGFGGLVVSMLASARKVAGSHPAEAVGFLRT
jgi:hypothetical protein